MAKSPILGGFATQNSSDAGDSDALNLCVEVIETRDGIVPGFLFGASGLDLLDQVGRVGLIGGAVGSGGTGYAFGDVIVLIPIEGGNFGAPRVRVTTLTGSAVTGFDIIDPGDSSGIPSGFTQFSTTGTGTGFILTSPTYDFLGPGRGGLPLNDVLYVVSGPEVISITANGIHTLCGTIGDETTPVSMFQNKKQLLIVDGVGAWLVPGGLPLTGGVVGPVIGTVNPAGGLYAVNDTILLKASSGFQSAFPVATVTAVANNPVTDFILPNAGTGYSTASNVATTNIQPHPGGGSGLTINITAVAGEITAASITSGGTNYAANDTGLITVGSQDAVYRVTSVGGGVVTGFILLNRGTAYAITAAATTKAAPGIATNVGTGFTVDIAAAGPISGFAVHTGGHGYVVGVAGFITGGGVNATYLVNRVGPTGSVTGFTITSPGAISDPAISFTQKSTTGSGAGFTLTSPTYGAFVGLVPIDMPFPNPVMGGVVDGFGVLVFLNSQNIASSDQEDLSTWQPLNFGVANQSPDNCVTLGVIHDEVYIIKEKNTEIWNDQGLPNFPFGPLSSNHIESGCIAPFSVALAEEELIWLSRNDQGEGIVVKASGYSAVPISTQALVAEFQKYPNLGDAIAYARQEGQHVYYVITFPEADKTWQYDKTSSKLAGFPIWTRLGALDNGQIKRHWGNFFTPFKLSAQPSTTFSAYDPKSVTITSPEVLQTGTGLTGLPSAVSTALLSIWVDLPDADGSGIYFSNQTDDTLGSTNPGLLIKIENDTLGTPQLSIAAFDMSNAPIVGAGYAFTNWAAWVNLLISIDTTTQQLQVYANTIVAGSLVETLLTPTAISWSSTNPIAPSFTQPWHVSTVP
jgi:hypothetical protein